MADANSTDEEFLLRRTITILTALVVLASAASAFIPADWVGRGSPTRSGEGSTSKELPPPLLIARIETGELCRSFSPAWVGEHGTVVLTDRSFHRPDQRSPFVPKSQIAIVYPGNCPKGSDGVGSCSFRVEALDGARVVSIGADGQTVYVLYDHNWLAHVDLTRSESPIVRSTVRIDQESADVISNYNESTRKSAKDEAHFLSSKVSSARKQLDRGERLVGVSFRANSDQILSSDEGLRLAYRVKQRRYQTEVYETDLLDPILTDDGIFSWGFDQLVGPGGQKTVEKPFSGPLGFMEPGLPQSFRAIAPNNRTGLSRSVSSSGIKDVWSFEGRTLAEVRCTPNSENRVDYTVDHFSGLSFKIFKPKGVEDPKNVVVYFFGGPSGQLMPGEPGLTIRELVQKGNTVIVPYGSGAVGAGLSNSSRIRNMGVQAFENDAGALAGYLEKRYPNAKYKLLGYSFGGVAATQYAALFPNSVSSLVLVAPFARSRPPSEYRTTVAGIAYQEALERAWFGKLVQSRNKIFNSYLSRLYGTLHGVKFPVHFVFGTIDTKSKPADVPNFSGSENIRITQINADHQLVTIHPDTNTIIYQEFNY